MEHYLELYSTENTVSEEALKNIQVILIMVELDSKPISSEIEKAINGWANGKAPGNDTIPPEVIKQKGYQSYFPIYMNFFPSAGKKVKYLKTCVMPRLSHFLRIQVIAVIVTTIMEFPS